MDEGLPAASDRTAVRVAHVNPEAPLHVRLAVAAVLAEALALLALGVGVLVSVSGDRIVSGLTSAVFFGLSAAGLAFSGWGLGQLRRWSRSPIVMTQVIQLGVAWSFYGDDTVWVAAVLAPIALGVLLAVLNRSTTELLYGRADDPDDDDADS